MSKECELCVKRKTMYCPNSSKCYSTEEKPFYQNRIMLLDENQRLKEQLHKASMDIQELVERDIMCPTNCEMLDKYKSVLDEIREYINNNVAVYAFNNPDLPHWEFNDDDIKHILQILDKMKE